MAASLAALRDYGYRAEIPSSVSEAVAQAGRSTTGGLRFDGPDRGFTLLSLQAALIACWRAGDFESGLRAVVEAGGDTDTNGAIAGALLGARFGHAAIPERWRRRADGIRGGARVDGDLGRPARGAGLNGRTFAAAAPERCGPYRRGPGTPLGSRARAGIVNPAPRARAAHAGLLRNVMFFMLMGA